MTTWKHRRSAFMRRFVRSAAIFTLLLLALPGDPQAQVQECRGVQKPQQIAELMFGRNIGGRIGVNESKWRRFVEREITARFPEGFTVYNASGQWRDRTSKRIVREPSKIVMIVLPGRGDDLERLAGIAEAYTRQFRQQSVGVILRPACVSF
jgi:hypothetical protein